MLRLLKAGTWAIDPRLVVARRIVFEELLKSCRRTTLGELAHFQNGRSYDPGSVATAGTPIIRISNITDPTSAYIYTTETFPEKWWVRREDLLVSWSASFKSCIWLGPDGMLNQHIFKVTPGPGVVKEYVRHAIEASFAQMREQQVGIGMMHLRRDVFLNQPVSLPSPSTQRAVAKYLDAIESGAAPDAAAAAELAAADRRISRFNSVFARIELVRRARYRKPQPILGRTVGVGQEGRLLMNEALRRFAARFDSRLGTLASILVQPLRHGPPLKCSDEGSEQAIPVLLPSATTGFGLDTRKVGYLPAGTTLSPLDYLQDGDILFARGNKPEQVGTAGIFAGSPSNATYANLFMRLRVDPALYDQRFVVYWLMTPVVREHVRQHTKGTGPSIQKINSTGVKSIPFPIDVPRPVQEAFVRHLGALELLSVQLETTLAAQTKRLDQLAHEWADAACASESAEAPAPPRSNVAAPSDALC